jgi:transcription-repair coupling factor (superfamily II helicase)
VAQDLLDLYRERASAPGHAFAPDTPWQAEMEALFAFTETPDQLQAINDVKADMEQPRPMDRLVCAVRWLRQDGDCSARRLQGRKSG